VLARRDALVRAGGYRPAFAHAEDHDLWLRVSEGAGLANLEEIVLNYRVHGGQVSHAQVRQQALSGLAARACAAARRSGLRDPAEGRASPVDEPFLRTLGVSADAVGEAVVDAFVYRAGLLGRLGFDETAEGLAGRLALEVLPADSRRRALAEASWVRGRLARTRGEWLRAARHVVEAVLRRPAFVANVARLLVRGGRSRVEIDGSHLVEP
jgi:hypothetical protein